MANIYKFSVATHHSWNWVVDHRTMTAQAQNDFLGTVPNANPMASIISRTDVSNPSTEDWVNVFGPSGYNVQPDNTRHRKLGRVHLPDVLKVIKIHIDLFFLFTYCYFRQRSGSFFGVSRRLKYIWLY
jgi:hypothetical protein